MSERVTHDEYGNTYIWYEENGYETYKYIPSPDYKPPPKPKKPPKEKPPPVYHDTFDFRIFPKYEYTAAQKARLNLFQGTLDHWRKSINYADSFVQPNKINLLYMLGYDKNMRNMVLKSQSNLVVLCAKIPTECLSEYVVFDEWLTKQYVRGSVDKDGVIKDDYAARRASVYERAANGDAAAMDEAEEFRDFDRHFADYDKLCARINKCYERYTIIDKLHPEKTIDHKDLDKIIKRYFPFGREQCNFPDATYKGIKLVDDAIRCGLSGGDGLKLLKVRPDDKVSVDLINRHIKRCEMNINVKLRGESHANLVQIYEEMTQPPYGWGYGRDAMAAYCFSKALSGYAKDCFIYNSYVSSDPARTLYEIVPHIVKDQIYRDTRYWLCVDDGWHLADRFGYMFDVESVHPFDKMLHVCYGAINKHTRYPVALLDDRLHEILTTDCNSKFYDYTYRNDGLKYFDTDTLREWQKYFTWDKCREIHEKYLTINDDVEKYLFDKMPGLTQTDLHWATNENSGWLWDKYTFWGMVYNAWRKPDIPTSQSKAYIENAYIELCTIFDDWANPGNTLRRHPGFFTSEYYRWHREGDAWIKEV